MSLYLQENIIPIIISAIDAGGQESNIAAKIKEKTDKSHGSSWHCVVGTQFGSYVTHTVGYFLYLEYEKYSILLWKSV